MNNGLSLAELEDRKQKAFNLDQALEFLRDHESCEVCQQVVRILKQTRK